MLLPADPHPACQPVRGLVQFRFRLAAFQLHARCDQRGAVFQRAVDVEPMGEVDIVNLCQPGGLARDLAGFRDDRENRLAVELTFLSASNGSSWCPPDDTSLTPGTSAPVNTQTTPDRR